MQGGRDFEQARRGLVAGFDPPVVEDARGRTVSSRASAGSS